jgi:hypothetical protein
MANKRSPKSSGGVNIKGNVNTSGGDIAVNIEKGDVHQNIDSTILQIDELFDHVYKNIDTNTGIPLKDKEAIKVSVDEIKQESIKGADRNEGFIETRLQNIGKMAPDILEIVLKTIANPMIGLATLAQKIQEKATENPDKKKE